jgi:isoleucyl-tRNA synthetase
LNGESVTVAGERLGPDDVTVTRTPRPGTVVESSGPLAVSLDTTLTDDLRDEGMAREVTSRVQQLRRDSGLEVSDRIELRWATSDETLAQAIRAHESEIAGEVLATRVTETDDAETETDVEGAALRLTVTAV